MKNIIGEITISSGGTIVPIDKMRVITNKSKGTTGAKLAEYILSTTESKVNFITTGSGILPFIRDLQLNALLIDSKHVMDSLTNLNSYINSGKIKINHVPYFDNYKEAIMKIATKSKPGDVAIIAAAVSDYGMKNIIDGKIDSNKDELLLELERLPKIIELVRQQSESLVIIGFKLIPDEQNEIETQKKLIEASMKQMNGPGKTDLVVANSTSIFPGSDKLHATQTLFVYPDGSYKIINRDNLEESLFAELPGLIKKRLKIA